MNIVGFNFTRINAMRKQAVVGAVNINNNISLREIVEAKIGIGAGDRQAIRISFTFKSTYAPDMATLEMDGDVLGLLEKKQAEQVIADWKKEKRLPNEVAQRVMNHILDRCNIQALLLSKDLNLPSPVPLPKVNMGPQKVQVVSEKVAKETVKKAKKAKK